MVFFLIYILYPTLQIGYNRVLGGCMKSLIVYDSYFGNTELVANTIHEVFEQSHKSKLIHISEAYDLNIEEFDLIVVGSPTRYYKPTEPIVEFVREVKPYSLKVAFFDTRMDAEGHWLLGPIENLLGFAVDSMVSLIDSGEATMDIEPLGVYVKSTQGPVSKGSIKDIQAWATLLLASLVPLKKQAAKPKAKVKAPAKAKPKAVAKAKPKPKPKASAKPKVAAKPKAKPKANVTVKATPTVPKRPPIKGAKKDKSLLLGDGPVYAVDLSSGKRIDLQTMTVAELKQFAKDNFNKGYEDLNRSQLILLNGASAIDIKEQARQKGIKNYSKMRKSELIKLLTSGKK
jgi:hypothetical protein